MRFKLKNITIYNQFYKYLTPFKIRIYINPFVFINKFKLNKVDAFIKQKKKQKNKFVKICRK